jgi:hypothetical protein
LVVEAPLFGSVPRGFPHYLVEAPRHTALPMGFGLALARTDLRVVVLTTPDEAAQPRVSWKRLAERAGLAILVMNKEPDVDETAREVPRLAEAWEIIRSAGLGFAVRVARRDFTSAARALASAWEHDGVRVVVFE